MNRKQSLTLKQEGVAKDLARRFGIDPERIYFLNEDKPDEPWLPAEALVTIARQTEDFQTIDESFDQYIGPLNQVVHRATVITKDGRTYTRSGVATIGERQDIDDHALAAGRAVSAALTAAGFHPLRPGSVVSDNGRQPAGAQPADDVAEQRRVDLRRIHALAEQKGLIKPRPGGLWDRTAYRQFLLDNYQTNTAVGFDSVQRASLINALEQLPEAGDDVEDEFREVA